MKTMLKEDAGLPRRLLYTLAVISGVSVANLYYNQPLLDMIRQDLGISTLAANHIALYSQAGYALGLLFLIPLADLPDIFRQACPFLSLSIPRADLVSRRRILLAVFALLILSLAATAAASDIRAIHGFSLVIGICSVVPQFFIPLAAQYSRPEEKNRNVGIVLSGLLTGILASRVVSGAVGEWLGWREMYVLATGLMTLSAIAAFRILPDTRPNFSGSYGALMRSLFTLLRQYPLLRLYSVRAAFAFGALLCFWASLAFKMAQAPFHAGSDIVGILGLCGIAGALTATVAGKYITRVGIHRFNCIGALLQFIAWALFLFGAESYASFVFGIVAIDIGMQCIQLSIQAPLFGLCPAASNRINTIFMSTYFAGGTLGTFLSGAAWAHFGWPGVVAAGALLTAASLSLTLLSGK